MKHMNKRKYYLNGLRHLTHAHFEEDPNAGGGGGGGGDEPSFSDSLPEKYRDHAAFKDFKNMEGMADSFINLQSMIGNSIRIPGEDASDEDRTTFNNKVLEKVPALMPRPNMDDAEQAANFHKSIGVPDEEGGYEIPAAEIPEGVNFDPESLVPFKAIAKKHNLTAGQFKGVMEDFQAMSFANAVAGNEAQAGAMKELATEWGNAYDNNLKVALNIAEKTGAPEGVIEGMKNGHIPPGMVKYFHSLAARFGKEGNELGDNQEHGGDGSLTPAEAKFQLNEIMNNKGHAYWDSKNPNHKAARDKAMKLRIAANPGASTDEQDLYRSVATIGG